MSPRITRSRIAVPGPPGLGPEELAALTPGPGEVVVGGPDGPVSVATRVNAAAYSTLQVALNAGAGKTVYIGPGLYSISEPLTPAAGTTVELHTNAVIEQTTAWRPIFDLLDAPDAQIIGGQFEWNGARTYIVGGDYPGNSYRWSDGADQSVAIWSNSDRSKVIGAKIYGFMRAVFFYGWNGTTIVAGKLKDGVIEDIEFDSVQTAIVAGATENIRIHNVRGKISAFSGGTPGHLLYMTDAGLSVPANINPQISDLYQSGMTGVGSNAFQIKGTKGGFAHRLYAAEVPTLILLTKTQDFRIDGFGATHLTDTIGYAVSASKVSTDSELQNITLENGSFPSIASGQKIAWFDGIGNTLRDVKATISTATVSAATGAVNLSGGIHTAKDIDIREVGAGAMTAVMVHAGDGHRVENIRSNKSEHLVRVLAGSASVSYDPARSTITQNAMLNQTPGSGTARLTIPTTRVSTSAAAGATVTPNPSRQTTTAISATGATVTIANPTDRTATVGGQHTIEITNDSGGALTVSWGTAYVFGPAWVSPAAGKTIFITFQYNGTNWVEVSRTA